MMLLACVTVLALTVVLTPPVIALAWRIGAVDVPSDWRRMHRESIPRDGGIAIFLAFAIGYAFFCPRTALTDCALGGGALLLLVGLADDMFCLNAWVKLAAQVIVASSAIIGGGFTAGYRTIAAVFWVVLLTNAHNLIDGLDGLFAGCAAIEGGALCLLYTIAGGGSVTFPPLLLALACFGFRLFNKYPAQVFAGDCGSGSVGFLLGMFSLPALLSPRWETGIVAPLLIFAYPLTDLTAAVVRRILRGDSPFRADRAHLHHRICAAGLTQVQSCGVLLTVSAGIGVVGVLTAAEGYALAACLACLAAAALLIRLRYFIAEFV